MEPLLISKPLTNREVRNSCSQKLTENRLIRSAFLLSLSMQVCSLQRWNKCPTQQFQLFRECSFHHVLWETTRNAPQDKSILNFSPLFFIAQLHLPVFTSL